LQVGGQVYLDGDELLLHPHFSNSTVRIGFKSSNDYSIKQVNATESGFEFSIDGERYSLPLLGEHNVKNAAYCILVSKKLGLSIGLIQQGLSNVTLSGMRLQKLKGSKGELIINDAYNASPTSMIAAITAIKSIPNVQNRIVVLGDMYELGEHEEALHRSVAQVIQKPITHLIAVGEKAKWIANEWSRKASPSIFLFQTLSKEDAENYLASIVDENTVVLFKASRGMKLEQIIERYQAIRKEE
jgi:UDP-N-acetylmuramoyl-tripeptide--D-alanyl-D-alanine ligase